MYLYSNDEQLASSVQNTILILLCDQYILCNILRYDYSYNNHFVQYSEMQWCLIVCKLHDYCCCDCLQIIQERTFFNNFLFSLKVSTIHYRGSFFFLVYGTSSFLFLLRVLSFYLLIKSLQWLGREKIISSNSIFVMISNQCT